MIIGTVTQMKMHYVDEDGESYHRRPEFGFCWVKDSAYEDYLRRQSEDLLKRLELRNKSRRRRGVKTVSPKVAAKRAERYRESLSLDMDFGEYIRQKMYKPRRTFDLLGV